jgi:DNA polymerase III epsilon subunit-like protein
MHPFNRKHKVVFFNLKTTNFKGPVRLLQIGAVDSYGYEIFNKFVMPGPIPEKALRGSPFRIEG